MNDQKRTVFSDTCTLFLSQFRFFIQRKNPLQQILPEFLCISIQKDQYRKLLPRRAASPVAYSGSPADSPAAVHLHVHFLTLENFRMKQVHKSHRVMDAGRLFASVSGAVQIELQHLSDFL